MRFDPNNWNHQAIVNALIGMVEDDGNKPSEVLDIVQDIVKDSQHSLTLIYRTIKGDPKPQEIRGLLNDNAKN